MPKVSIEKSASLTAEESFSRVKKLLETDDGIRSYDPQFSCEFDDSKLSGKASGGLFKALLQVTSTGNKSSVTIELDLPMKLALVKGVIKSKLESKLDDCLS